MLYVTTRSIQDAFTAYRAIHQDRGPDGGFFAPMKLPVFTQKDILRLSKKSFGQNIADVVNVFFGTKITGWDVDVTIGRRVFTTKLVGHRTHMGHLWNDAYESFQDVVRALAVLVRPELTIEDALPEWLDLGIRIAYMFGIFGELLSSGVANIEKGIDVAVASETFATPMALWYARRMGLPVRTIVCGCNENGIVWDLLHRGVADTGALAVKTSTPEADFAVPPGLERLVFAALGHEEAVRYWRCCTEGKSYTLSEVAAETISKGMFAAVVSMDRVSTILPSVYRTNRYILEPYGALAYGALADYRARTGAVGLALALTERSPGQQAALVAEYMQITPEELDRILNGD